MTKTSECPPEEEQRDVLFAFKWPYGDFDQECANAVANRIDVGTAPVADGTLSATPIPPIHPVRTGRLLGLPVSLELLTAVWSCCLPQVPFYRIENFDISKEKDDTSHVTFSVRLSQRKLDEVKGFMLSETALHCQGEESTLDQVTVDGVTYFRSSAPAKQGLSAGATAIIACCSILAAVIVLGAGWITYAHRTGSKTASGRWLLAHRSCYGKKSARRWHGRAATRERPACRGWLPWLGRRPRASLPSCDPRCLSVSPAAFFCCVSVNGQGDARPDDLQLGAGDSFDNPAAAEVVYPEPGSHDPGPQELEEGDIEL